MSEPNQTMYQVHVTTKDVPFKPVGPKFSTRPAAEQLCQVMRLAIAANKLHGWNDPQVFTLTPIEEPDHAVQ